MPREKIAQFSSAPPLNRLKSAATPPPVLSDAVRNHSCSTAWLTPGVVIAAPKRTITTTASVNKMRRRNSGILTVFRNAETLALLRCFLFCSRLHSGRQPPRRFFPSCHLQGGLSGPFARRGSSLSHG